MNANSFAPVLYQQPFVPLGSWIHEGDADIHSDDSIVNETTIFEPRWIKVSGGVVVAGFVGIDRRVEEGKLFFGWARKPRWIKVSGGVVVARFVGIDSRIEEGKLFFGWASIPGCIEEPRRVVIAGLE